MRLTLAFGGVQRAVLGPLRQVVEGGGVVPAVDQQHGVGVTVVVPGDRLESLRSGGVPDRKLSKETKA